MYRGFHAHLRLLLTALLIAGCATPAGGRMAQAPEVAPSMAPAAGATQPATAPRSVLPIANAGPTAAPTPPPTPGPRTEPALSPTLRPPSPAPVPAEPGPFRSPIVPTILPTPPPGLDPAPAAGKFELDLYEKGDFVSQVNNATCVAASMQMMINMLEPGKQDRSKESQLELYELARAHSPWIHVFERDGASSWGWADGMAELGYGSFEVWTLPTMAEGLRAAARQMRFTGKPAGLMVWQGRHAWVMSGFKATADPAWTDDFEVTAIWVEDPWYGWRDASWGRGHAPHSLLDAEYVLSLIHI